MRRLLAIAWLLCMVLAAPVAAQSILERLITPGPLASGHAKLESSCDSCHSSFRKEAQNDKCLACHKGIRADIAGKTRYHGKYGPARTAACKSCHSDHKGRGYALIRLDRNGFDHNLTAYPLTGGHAKVGCASCHGKGSNYRGITRDCANCHKSDDPHRGQLGRNCQTCHTTGGWKSVKGFDHRSTGFALTGAHARAACMSCHQGQRWKDLGTSCVSCHAKDDAHRGSRGTNCAGCHTTTAWRAVTFDHDSTDFPLIGGHAAAACAGCHGAGNAEKHPSRSCFACHAGDDTHKGANGNQCQSCHTPRSWRQILFDHDSTSFPLKGAHRGAACKSCHKQPAKLVKPPVTCFGCHAADDAHKGGNGQDCERCHAESSWKKVNFNHDTMTEFPLRGRHAKAKCEACHTRPTSELKLSTKCGSCHKDDDAHSGKLGAQCSRCHDSADWKTDVRFDHELTRFPLLGKHASLECKDCHADKSYAASGITCASCHQDDHHKGTLGTPAACGTCHNAMDWKAWRFDHDTQTNFALDGRHKGLVCSACHARAGDPARQGDRCIDCHRRDDVHRGNFGGDCQRCHLTSSFRQIVMPKR